MKIFSLETKKHLVGWGIVTSLLFQGILYWVSYGNNYKFYGEGGSGWPDFFIGLPFKIHISDYIDQAVIQKIIGNFIFWILVSLVILFLIRYFRKNLKVN